MSKLTNSSYNGTQSLLYRIENSTEAQILNIYKEGEIINTTSFTSTTYSETAIIDAMRNRPYTVLIRVEGKNGKLIEDLSISFNKLINYIDIIEVLKYDGTKWIKVQ